MGIVCLQVLIDGLMDVILGRGIYRRGRQQETSSPSPGGGRRRRHAGAGRGARARACPKFVRARGMAAVTARAGSDPGTAMRRGYLYIPAAAKCTLTL